ncbi:hypothetical protein EES38_15590 [Vibrio viridaestus]|uniref:Uncharacterized protein n=2 Tax=Vibrio viridaestus TaxID=2487322 RepID=A0A3N9TD68_9VIBR|nr:hypothetical protein EES38_15590 [Vibrio viridaestus]
MISACDFPLSLRFVVSRRIFWAEEEIDQWIKALVTNRSHQ